MGLLDKVLGSAMEAQVRKLIREEADTAIKEFLNPTFIAAMTSGRQDLERMLDVVVEYEDALKAVDKRVTVLEKLAVKTG